jgi:hypothetical protein
MKKAAVFIKSKLALVGIVVVAAVIGGATTSLVRASIPDGSGTIHSCYTTGLLARVRIIDSANQNCNGNETALNWSQQGGKALHDAGGQFIGNIVSTPGETPLPWVVYNPTLNRIIYIVYSGSANEHTIISPRNGIYYESNDCTGQAYTFDDANSSDLKTNLLRVGSTSYGIVQNNTSPQTKTAGSIQQYDYSADTFNCNDIADATDSYYEISSVSLPFTTPLERPFKF